MSFAADKEKKTVVLGVTGSIAAYKAADIISALKKENVQVFAVMTKSACQFIAPLTLETLSAHSVACEMFSREAPWEIEHIALAKRADVLLVAPATANFIGKLAHGIADDILSTTAMATRAPLLIAPAMNVNMYQSAANQANMRLLAERGCRFIQPKSGMLACGDEGVGKLADISVIVSETLSVLGQSRNSKERDWTGRRVLVGAGPTREAIDPVRYLSNRSSGKMGYAMAAAAAERGAETALVTGPTNLDTPVGVRRVDVVSAQEMFDAMNREFEGCDVCVMAAAPADFRPESSADDKIKKQGAEGLVLPLVQTPDILAALTLRKGGRFVCGFAAETRDLTVYAKDKLRRKGLDMIAANDVSNTAIGFDSQENALTLYFADGSEKYLAQADKRVIAHGLLDEIAARMGNT